MILHRLSVLEAEIRKIIETNKKFLERVMDDDFEPDDQTDEEDEPLIEEL